ncbi:MAG: hypothetical protein PUH21_08095 [Prevotellaceae bacterium]|jgi:hypothetical protein|nr:hypothetical protein [Prevotellaceae bacterium]MDY3855908.1 hypothetical protein [Bacteroidaceae bacterium]
MKSLRGMMLLATIVVYTSLQAQKVENFGVFRHIGAGVSVGTEGIGFNVASPVTDYLELGMGINFMPGIKIKGDVDMNINTSTIPPQLAGIVPSTSTVNIKGDLARTTLDFKASVYPFGTKNALFVVAGFSFGGKKIAKLTGHSDLIQDHPELRPYIVANVDKYDLEFDENGDVKGDVRVNAFRPYLGLGYGRQVPKHRVGFRVEMGCHFMGKMKVYQNGQELDTNDLDTKGDDDVSKFIDKFRVYPVLKLTLTGRIF